MSGGRRAELLALCSSAVLACAPPCVDDGLHAKQAGSACQSPATTGATTAEETTEAPATSGTGSGSTGDEATGTTTGSTTSGTSTSEASTESSETGSESSGGPGPCFDDVPGPDETGLDCGGICPPCPNQQPCLGGSDCVSGTCHFNAKCVPPHCADGIYDPVLETHVDCGGACGGTCSLGLRCESLVDCHEGTCEGEECVLDPLCGDDMVSPGETGLDCGGICGPTCPEFFPCMSNGDCVSDSCVDSVCEGPDYCEDGMQNYGETAVDCGGHCFGCFPGQQCVDEGDCSGLCVGNVCA